MASLHRPTRDIVERAIAEKRFFEKGKGLKESAKRIACADYFNGIAGYETELIVREYCGDMYDDARKDELNETKDKNATCRDLRHLTRLHNSKNQKKSNPYSF